MKFIITTFGSAGDVHPFMALALELGRRGHEAVIVTSGKFAPTMAKAGIRCVPLGTAEDFDAQLADPRLWDPDHALGFILDTVALSLEATMDLIAAEVPADSSQTVLVGSSLAFAARILRDRLRIPLATVHLAPSLFWSKYAPPYFDPRSAFLQHLPPFVVGWFYGLIERMIGRKFAGSFNAKLREIGHGEVRRIFSQWVHSPDLTVGMFPKWFGLPQRDWPSPLFMAGFPRFAEDHEPTMPTELGFFLTEGPSPVAFAPGSANTQSAGFFRESAEACRRLGCRAVFVSPSDDCIPRGLQNTVHVRYVPFKLLFPYCAAVVHHGGIGTTAQCFGAGVPQLAMPMAHDQFDNAHRIAKLGVGKMLPAKSYTGATAARDLGALLGSATFKDRAKAIKAIDTGADWDGLIPRLVALRK